MDLLKLILLMVRLVSRFGSVMEKFFQAEMFQSKEKKRRLKEETAETTEEAARVTIEEVEITIEEATIEVLELLKKKQSRTN